MTADPFGPIPDHMRATLATVLFLLRRDGRTTAPAVRDAMGGGVGLDSIAARLRALCQRGVVRLHPDGSVTT